MIEAPLNLGAELLRGGVPMDDGLHLHRFLISSPSRAVVLIYVRTPYRHLNGKYDYISPEN